MSKTNPFAGIGEASQSGGAGFLAPGKYRLRFMGAKTITSAVKRADMFICNFEVIESADSGEKDAAGRPVTASPPGSARDWIVNFQYPSALSNIRHFVAALVGCSFEEVDEDVAASVTEDEGAAFAGTEVSAEAFTILTKEKKNPFTKIRWEHVEG